MVRKSIPLARQVVQEILTGIESGKLARANGALPSEAELGARFEVSRATVREALTELERRNLVIRKHGVGTFVSLHPKIDAGLEELASLETLAQRIGVETHMGQPLIEEREATVGERKCLQMSQGGTVLSISRVIATGKRPIAYLVDIVPATILRKKDLAHDFRGSVLDLFARRSDLPLSHSRTDILIEQADETTARKLALKKGEPLHKLEAELYTQDGRVIDYSTSYFVPGYFHFHVNRRVAN